MDLKMLGFYSVTILLNILVNLYFYFGSRKHEIYKWALIFWANGFIFFGSQAVFSNNLKIAGLFAILVSINDFAVIKIISLLLKIPTRDKFYAKVSIPFFIVGIIASFFTRFEVFTTIISLGVIFPYFHFMISNFKEIQSKSNRIEKFMLFFYSINVAHMLDYAFFTMDKDLYHLGFNIAYAFTMVLTLFIHITSDSVYIKRIEEQLKEEIDKKNSLYKTIIANDIVISFSHEMNNALQGIQFQQEMLKLKVDNHPENKSLEKVARNIQNGVNKIQDILNPFYANKSVSKIDLSTIVNESVSFLEPTLAKEKVNLKVSKVDDLSFCYVLASKGLMSQLLVYAVKSLISSNKDIVIDVESHQITLKCFNTENADLDLVNFMISQIGISIKTLPTSLIIDLNKIRVKDPDEVAC